MPNITNAQKIISDFKNKKVLVIGDVMLDQYSIGEITRISPEAPVPVLKKKEDKYVLGGAGNVAANLSALGAAVTLIGVVGEDQEANKIHSLLDECGIASSLLSTAKRPTTLKQRFVVNGGQQLLRADREITEAIGVTEEDWILTKIEKIINEVDGVMFADYNKGLFSDSSIPNIIKLIKKSGKKIFADIKPGHHLAFKGVDYLKPNLKEVLAMTGEADVERAAVRLAAEFDADIFVTMGGEGILIASKTEGGNVSKQSPSLKIKVFDVSGAGDTTAATAFLSLLSGASLLEAASLANFAGGIVVQKPGTATVGVEELSAFACGGHNLDALEIVPKVWGYEKWIENNDRYCGKILALNKGYQCSLHYHKNKDETFLILKGLVKMEVENDVSVMPVGSFVRLLPGTKHRFSGLEDSEILEISTHHEDGDSYRLEDSKKI